jgi:transposase InsO family protein
MGGRHCLKAWRAGCGESRTSGSEGGPEKPAGGNVRTALRSDPYTYIPMARGFLFLVAIIDLYSRRALAWRLSNSLETSFCLEALREALERYGRPEIFNTDQGAQFPSEDFTSVLLEHSRSAWTAGGAASTTSSSSGSGVR